RRRLVETRHQGRLHPIVNRIPSAIGRSICRLPRIVEDDVVRALSGHDTVNRGPEAITLSGCAKLLKRRPSHLKPCARKHGIIDWAAHELTGSSRKIIRKILAVRGADDLRRRVATQKPSRKSDGG